MTDTARENERHQFSPWHPKEMTGKCVWFCVTALALILVAVLWATPIMAGHIGTNEVKVAFIGDQGVSENAKVVLEFIKSEGADIVLHQGDLGYGNGNDPQSAIDWDNQINDVLGPDFPYFASIGNHDVEQWSVYQQKLQERLDRIVGGACTGDLGVKSICTYRGLFFILSGVGTSGDGHESFIKDQLASDDSPWRICSWHVPQTLMQIGTRGGNGFGPYEECRKGGGIVATAHEHSYARTHLMDNVEIQSVVSTSNTLRIQKGRTFIFHSGLGGESITNQDDELAANPWWAAVHTDTQAASQGALFCTFNENGFKDRAHCYFKDLGRIVPDRFDIISNVNRPGDVNEDGVVNIVDLKKVAGALGTSDGADLSGDGLVNIRDLALVGINLGRGGP